MASRTAPDFANGTSRAPGWLAPAQLAGVRWEERAAGRVSPGQASPSAKVGVEHSPFSQYENLTRDVSGTA